ncbi:MAG: poly-beta-1,6-N-acetyl-D-glucosamine N-deacetylase PgaB [bacterium]
MTLSCFIISFAKSDALRCVQVFTLESQDIESLQTEFQHLKECGFNTLIIRVFKNPGDSRYQFLPEKHSAGVYFASSTEPIVADILTPVLAAAHKLDMKVFAWITTRKSQWLLKAHPEWASPAIDPETGLELSGGHLDIFRSDAGNRMLGFLTELADSGVDGVLLQDDLVSRQYEDFFTNSWLTFKGRTFQKADLHELFNLNIKPYKYRPSYYNWARHKTLSLAKVLKYIVTHLKKRHPNLTIAVNLYYETVVSPHHGRLWLSQDLEEFASIPIDYWAIMAYQLQIAKELNLSLEQIADKLKLADKRLQNSFLIPRSRILWKFQTQDWQTGRLMTTKEWERFFDTFSPDQYVLAPYRNRDSIRSFVSATLSKE